MEISNYPRPVMCAAIAVWFSLAMAGQGWSAEPETKSVIDTYARIAQAAYEDALATARALRGDIERFLADPGTANLRAAKAAWIAARVPYQQTEAFRFGNPIVDEWEGKVNAWPLDEGLIDYVAAGYEGDREENSLTLANVIANPSLKVGGTVIDARTINKDLLANALHEADGIEANVATGYHAIEFLLWGQDLNGTGPGSGARPASDYDLRNCSGGNCARRAAYLDAASGLLVDDLAWMAAQWASGGSARQALLEGGSDAGLVAIFTGLGSLSYGELAGERMKLGLMIHDPEEEHDCFSDNTHNSHYWNVVGLRNVYLGRYRRGDGNLVSGPSVSDLVRAKSPDADLALRAALDKSLGAMRALVHRAETVEAYDQMIGEGNAAGNAVVQAAIDALLAQTRAIERAVASLNAPPIRIEGSDSLDGDGGKR